MSLNIQERRTDELFGDIHALPDSDYIQTSRDRVLTAAHLGVADDFLAGKSALDAGTGGRGRALQGLYRMGSRDIVAIDLSETNIQNARRDNPTLDPFVTYKTANLLDLPFEPNCFDFIHCSGVAHHTADPVKAVAEMYRCLKPGRTAIHLAVWPGRPPLQGGRSRQRHQTPGPLFVRKDRRAVDTRGCGHKQPARLRLRTLPVPLH